MRKSFFRFLAITAVLILILLSLAPIVYVFAPQAPASTNVAPVPNGQTNSQPPVNVEP